MTSASALRPLHLGKMIPPPFAGMEAHVDTLLRALAPHADCTLVASDTRPNRPAADLYAPYRIVPVRSYGSVASTIVSPGLLGQLAEEIDAGRANLIHVHSPNPWGDWAILRFGARLPTVITWHSDIVRQRLLMQGYAGFQQRALARVDRIVVFTPQHRESSTQLRGPEIDAKVVHVPIGIDFARFDIPDRNEPWLAEIDAWAHGRPIALTVGRHVYYKGYEQLLLAMANAVEDCVLLMAGSGPLSRRLARRVSELGLDARVRLLGEIDHVTLVTALHRCDFFCLPSIEPSEAFGIASAEAMACGKPTLVCELHNGVTVLNRAGETSVVVPPRDVPALADAIDLLARDASLRTRLGHSARQWVRSQFNVARMRDATLELYRSLL